MTICLGFDYGVKKIGVAVGDTETLIANALTTVHAVNQKTGWNEITKLIHTWQPKRMVVGISGIYIKIVLREIITYMNDPSLFQQIKIYVKVVKITLNDWKKNEQT